jgi:SsrA-binding protein
MNKTKPANKKASAKGADAAAAPRLIAQHKKAYHHYTVVETLTAGIVLTGSEIKSIRAGKVSLIDSFARLEKGELWLYGMNIAPYAEASHFNHAPTRVRKLLLQRAEIKKLLGKLDQKGLTLVPLRLFFQRCWVKVELGVCQGKTLYDKRESIQTRESRREVERHLKKGARTLS